MGISAAGLNGTWAGSLLKGQRREINILLYGSSLECDEHGGKGSVLA